MLAVQTACDVAAHVIADEGLRPASSLAEGLERLAEQQVISRSTAAQLAARSPCGTSWRMHHRLDVAAVHAAATSGLSDLEAFAREVSTWLAPEGD